MIAEFVIADQSAVGGTAKSSELFFINLLEKGGLIELRGPFHILEEVFLGDVHDPDLQTFARLALIHEIVEPSPGSLELLEFRGVHDLVQLC